MSQESSDRTSYRFQEPPLLAEVVEATASSPSSFTIPPPAPRRSWKPVFIVGLVLLAAIVLISGGGFLVYRTVAQVAGQYDGQLPAPLLRPLVSQRATITAALDGAWQVNKSDARYREAERFLKKLEDVYARKNREAFVRQVDWPGHMQRYCQAYRFQPLLSSQRNVLAGLERDDFGLPFDARKFKIAALVEPAPDHWYVFTYAQEGTMADAAFLFHLRKHDQDWKLVDWADVGQMRWQSELQGVSAGRTLGDPSYNAQNQFGNDLTEVSKRHQQSDVKGAEEALRRAETRDGIKSLRDSNSYHLALWWYGLGNVAEAERLLGQVGDADEVPWAHHLQAQVSYHNDQHADALAAVERFERVAGFNRELAVIKVNCQAELKQSEAAAASAAALLRYASANEEAISLALKHLSAAQLPKVLALLPKTAAASASLVQTANGLLYQDEVEGQRRVRDYLAQIDPESEHVAQLDAQWQRYQGDFEAALATYEKLLQRAPDAEHREAHRSSYVSLLLQLKTPVEAYRQVSQPRETLAIMTSGIESDEAYIGQDDLQAILPLHRERDPQDPRLSWYAAQVARAKQDWPAAAKEIRAALAALPPGDDEEDTKAELEYELMRVRYHLGEALEAYRTAADSADAYHTLAGLMEGGNHWDDLKQLNALRPEKPEDLWRRYYGLRVEEAEARETADTIRLTETLAGYELLAEANSKLTKKTIYPSILENRIVKLSLENDAWLDYLQKHPEPGTLFTRLADRFRRQNDQEALDQLEAFARWKLPEHEAVERYNVEKLWDRRGYQSIITLLGSRSNTLGGQRYGFAYVQRQRLVLSHLLQNDTSSAAQVASEPVADEGLQFLVRLAEGNSAAVRSFLVEHEKELHAPLTLSADARSVPAIAAYLKSDEFHRLRNEIPLPPQHIEPTAQALLFFAAAPDVTAAALQKRLSAAGLPELAVESLAQPPLCTSTFRVRTAKVTCLLTCGNTPYVKPTAFAEYGSEFDETFKQALLQSQHWMALELPDDARGNARLAFDKMVAALTPGATALWAELPQYDFIHVALTPELAQDLAAKPTKLSTLVERDEQYAWLPRADETSGETVRRLWYSRCRAAASGTAQGRIQIRLLQGHAVEEHWLDVLGVTHKHWGQYELTARFQEASQLYPLYAKGDVVRVPAASVLKWEE